MIFQYTVFFKSGGMYSFTSRAIVQLDLDKPLFTIEMMSKVWKDQTEILSIPTSEILWVKYGQARDD